MSNKFKNKAKAKEHKEAAPVNNIKNNINNIKDNFKNNLKNKIKFNFNFNLILNFIKKIFGSINIGLAKSDNRAITRRTRRRP